MSRKVVKKTKPKKVSKVKRELVATRVAEGFNRMTPDQQRAFVDETLMVLYKMTRKQMRKMFSSFFKKGRPSTKDLETINQLIVVFTFSVKPEFQFHYAQMIYKAFNQPVPPNLDEELEKVRKQEWLHAGMSPKVYDRMFTEFVRMKPNSYDEFFTNLMDEAKVK